MNHVRCEDGVAWCGTPLRMDDGFYFKDIDQVIINNQFGERIPCTHCLNVLISTLLNVPVLTVSAQAGSVENYGDVG